MTWRAIHSHDLYPPRRQLTTDNATKGVDERFAKVRALETGKIGMNEPRVSSTAALSHDMHVE